MPKSIYASIQKVFIIAVAVLLLAACGNGNGSSNGNSGSGGATNADQANGEAQEEIVIAAVLSTSGTYGALGQGALEGIHLAVDEINEQGGLLGRTVRLIHEDDEGKPEIAQRKAEKIALEENVNLFICCNGSSLTNSLKPSLEDWNVVMIDPNSRPMSLTDPANINDHYYRYNHHDGQDFNAHVHRLLNSDKKYERLHFIGPDYNWGHDMYANVEQMAERLGIEIVGADFPPLGSTDFSTYLTNALANQADVIYHVGAGSDLLNIAAQAKNSGVLDKLDFLTLQLNEDVIMAIQDLEGIIGAVNYHWSLDIPENKPFVEKFEQRFNKKPDNFGAQGYGTAQMYFAAIEKAGSTDTEKIIQEFQKGMEFSSPVGKVAINPENHQVMHTAWIGEIVLDESGKSSIKVIHESPKEIANAPVLGFE